MADAAIRLGIIGLGRAFTLMLPAFVGDRRVRLVAAADPRPEARARFTADFAAPAYATDAELCADPAVEAVYIATPHQCHVGNIAVAAAAGRHILVEKPMALSLGDCLAIRQAAEAGGVRLIVGHSHSFDAPLRHAAALIAGGELGRLRMIQAMNYTDFLFRPRRPEELDTAQGGGAVFNQAPHQVDMVRLLGGGLVHSVRAMVGDWDPARPTEGAYMAQLRFADGACASLTYSGYAHYDSDELCGWVGESGQTKDPAAYGAARRALARAATPGAELRLREARGFGTAPAPAANGRQHEHFGFLLASCDHGDLRPLPDGVLIYGDDAIRKDTLPPPELPRQEVLDELHAVLRLGQEPAHDAAWGLATMEVCFAIRESARTGQEIFLQHQVPTRTAIRTQR